MQQSDVDGLSGQRIKRQAWDHHFCGIFRHGEGSSMQQDGLDHVFAVRFLFHDSGTSDEAIFPANSTCATTCPERPNCSGMSFGAKRRISPLPANT